MPTIHSDVLLSLLILGGTARADIFENWTWKSPLPTGNVLKSVVFAREQFIAVGDYGTILRSSDGTNWVISSSLTHADLSLILYGNDRFVAVGNEDDEAAEGWVTTFLTSTDGQTWSRTPMFDFGAPFTSLAFGDSRFVAVNATPTVLTSIDGINWDRTAAPTSLIAVTYGNGLFAAVGYGSAILTSPDGRQWTQTSSGGASDFNNIVYAGGLFWAMGTDREDGSNPQPVLLTSKDAVDWTRKQGIGSGSVYGIIQGNGQLVAWDSDGATLSSTDGATWTKSASNPFANAIAYGNGHLVAVGGTLLTSVDGSKWVLQGSALPYWQATALTYGKGRFVATARFNDSPERSGIFTPGPEGKWIEQLSGIPGVLSAIAYGNGRFVAAGYDFDNPTGPAGVIMTSADGLNWIRSGGDVLQEVALNTLTFGNGQFVGLGSDCLTDCRPTILTSADGLNWTSHQSDSLLHASGWPIYEMVYANGQFVAVGGNYSTQTNSAVFTSTDGVHWIDRYSPATNVLRGVTFGSGQFVAVGARQDGFNGSFLLEGTIITSTNGADWTLQASGPDYALNSVAYGNGEFVAVQGTRVLTSTDGIHWLKHASSFQESLPRITYGDGRFVIGGSGGRILELDTRISLVASPSKTDGLLSLTMTAPVGIHYTIESSTDLVFWQARTNSITAQEITQIGVAPREPARIFFRGYSN